MIGLALMQRAYDAVVTGKQPVTKANIIVVPEENMWWILFRVLGHVDIGRAAGISVVMPDRLCQQNALVVLATSFLFVQTNLDALIPDGSVVVACPETEALLSTLAASEAFVTIDPLNSLSLIVQDRVKVD